MGAFPTSARFSLTDVERLSPLWLRLHADADARLQLLRAKNDAVMPEAERNVLLGQIRELKRFLELGRPAPLFAAPDDPARQSDPLTGL